MLKHPDTPDRRYFIVRGANSELTIETKSELVSDLMTARRAIRLAALSGDEAEEEQAHRNVDIAKRALGERGPV